MLDTAISSYAKIKSRRIRSNISRDEAKALKNLTKQKDIMKQKADKGNTVFILDEEPYIEKMKELLGDTSKFECLEIPPNKHLNFVINSHDKIKSILKSLHEKESLTDLLYKKNRLLDAALVFNMAKLRYTDLSLTIVHVLDQYLTLLIHHRIS